MENQNIASKLLEYAKAEAALNNFKTNRNLEINELELKFQEIEQQIQDIREVHAPKQEELEKCIEKLFNEIKTWAEANPDFKEKRSHKYTLGTIRFRKSSPKLDLKEGVEWEEILEKFKESKLHDLYKVREVIDKSAIKKRMKDGEFGHLLGKLGILLVQDETFEIKLKK